MIICTYQVYDDDTLIKKFKDFLGFDLQCHSLSDGTTAVGMVDRENNATASTGW